MLTPLDIQKKDFRRTFRGYSEEDVDAFLDKVIQDYESLYRENQELKEKLVQADRNTERYREIEEVLKNTLVMAQKSAEELRQNSEKEARLTLDQARIEAGQVAREAEQEALALLQDAERRCADMELTAEGKMRKIMEEYHLLEREAHVFRVRFRSFLESQIRLLDGEEKSDPVVAKTEDGEDEQEGDDFIKRC